MSGLKKLKASRVIRVTAPCQGPPAFRPIFFLHCKGYIEVLKAERLLEKRRAGVEAHHISDRRTATRISFDNISFLMESVMKAPAGKSCTDAEIAELKKIEREPFESQLVRRKFIEVLGSKAHVLTRLEYLGGLMELSGGVDQVGRALKFKTALETDEKFAQSLGRLIALDLFLGNYDRFDYEGNIANIGNFFFREKGKKLKIVALDNFQDGSGHANLLRDHTRGGDEISSAGKGLNIDAFSAKPTAVVGRGQHLYRCILNLHNELYRLINGERYVNQGHMFKLETVGSRLLTGFQKAVPEIEKAIRARSKTIAGVPDQLVTRFKALETEFYDDL